MDFTLDRVRVVRDRLQLRFECPVISVGGTNGKGSTCAMIESIARHAGYRTVLYMSPHLVHFEERCLIDGRMADAATLLPHFEAVEAARGDVTLTYFEFTTLAILRAFVPRQARCGNPRGGPRRPARRGERVRRRLRRHDRRRRSITPSTWVPIANRSAARRRASFAPAGRRSSATRSRRPA